MDLHGKTTEELLAMIRQIEDDPKNQIPRGSGSIWLYTPKARKRLDQIALALALKTREKRKLAGEYVDESGYSGRQSKRRR